MHKQTTDIICRKTPTFQWINSHLFDIKRHFDQNCWKDYDIIFFQASYHSDLLNQLKWKKKYVMLCYKFLSRIASSVFRMNCYQWGSCVRGSSAFSSAWFINIALKLGAQLSILIVISSLWYDLAVTRTHNLPIWWRALYLKNTSRFEIWKYNEIWK